MKVIDLIIRLQQLPPNAEVKLDLTNENMNMFKFGPIVFVDEVDIATGETTVILSSTPLDQLEDVEDDFDPSLN